MGGDPSTWLGGRGLQRSFPSPVQHKKRKRKKKSTRGRIVRVFLSVASWRFLLHQLFSKIVNFVLYDLVAFGGCGSRDMAFTISCAWLDPYSPDDHVQFSSAFTYLHIFPRFLLLLLCLFVQWQGISHAQLILFVSFFVFFLCYKKKRDRKCGECQQLFPSLLYLVTYIFFNV